MKQILWRSWLGGFVSVMLMAANVPGVFAQNPAPKPEEAPKSAVVTTTSESSHVVEYFMVIVMFGAALFAVCRSSRRNV